MTDRILIFRKGRRMDKATRLVFVIVSVTILGMAAAVPADAAGNGTAGQARLDADRMERVRFHSEYGTSEVMSGRFTVLSGTTKLEKAYVFLAGRPASFRLADPQNELELLAEKSDALGLTHLRFQQVYEGLPVWGCQTIVHFEDDSTIYLVGGQTIPSPVLDVVPSVSEDVAIAAARAAVADKIPTDDLETMSELIVYPDAGEPRLARLVTVTSPTRGDVRWRVFVDARTGEVIDAFNDIHFDGPDVGSGPDVLGVNQTFNIYQQGGDFKMWDVTRAAWIMTYEDLYNGGPLSTDPDGDKIWDDDPGQKAAVSGHVNAALTYDYFLNTFGRNSYDGLGSQVTVNVHDPVYVNNAYWNGSSINFADGDGVNYLPFSGSLDVVAHELAHGVTQYTAGLIYRFQSGALNESYSDVFGACVDRDDWLLGDDIRLAAPGFIRSMADPTLRGHPDHMDDYQWFGIETDNGGVHSNSGIPNHAFYWAASLTSREVAEQIWYRALTQYLTPSSGMYFWSAMIMQAAEDLYGTGTTEHDNTLLALAQVGFNSTYPVPAELTMANIVGTVTYDTIWIHNPTSNTVSVQLTIPPSIGGLEATAPSSIAPGDSGAVALSFDTQDLDECDIGLYRDRLQITTDGAPYLSNIYVPIDILVGYTTTAIQTVSVSTACLSLTGRNTSGMNALVKSGTDVLYDGSLLIGVNDGGTKTTYREVFGNLSLIPVDVVTTDSVGKSFRIAADDGRIQGQVTYRWYSGADGDTCDFILVDYTLDNVCDTPLTVYPGLINDFDINNSGNNIASYDADQDLVYIKDNSSDRAAGFALLSAPAYNLRAIHNPDLVWGNNFTDEVAYTQLAASSNVENMTPSDYSALLGFGPTLLASGSSAQFTVAMLYSNVGVAGLLDALETARAFNSGIVVNYGDANGDGAVNVADAVYIINYVFKEGPAPDPLDAGDANCDGAVNVADAVYIINYVFKDGPVPGCP